MSSIDWKRRRLNKTLLTGLTVCAAGSLVRGPSASAAAVEDDDPTIGRSLVFDDGFARLDPAIWNAGPKATTGPSGFYGRAAFARLSGEAGFNPYDIVDDSAASDGKALTITARYIGERMKVPNYYGNDMPEYQWISGNLQTAGRSGAVYQGWREGYFEARMWFPRHPLTWPAFWFLNKNSILDPRKSVEIDVVEHKGWEPSLYGTYLHEWGAPGERHESTGAPVSVDLTSGYFRYGFLIEGERCAPYFERKRLVDVNTDRPAQWVLGRASEMDETNDVFWPLLTLALRNDVPFPDPLAEADRSATMKVDYLRVYA